MKINWRSVILRLILSGAVSALLIGALFSLVIKSDNVKLARFFELIRNVGGGLFFLYIVSAFGQAWFRAWRYRILVKAAAGAEGLPGMGHFFLVTLARNMMVDLLPARIGELIYVALLNQGYQVNVDACFSSLGVSFVFDFIALLGIVLVLLIGALVAGALTIDLALITGLLLVLSVTGLLVLFVIPQPVVNLFAKLKLPGKLGEWYGKLIEFMRSIVDALNQTRKGGVMLPTLVLSLAVRLIKYAGFYCLFLSFTQTNFPAMAELATPQAVTALIAGEAGGSLPLPTLMSFGSYEIASVGYLVWMGIAAEQAVAAMFSLHLGSQFVDYTVGGMGLFLLTLIGMQTRRKTRAKIQPQTDQRAWLRFALGLMVAGTVFILFAGFAFWKYRKFKKMGGVTPPAKGEAVKGSTAEKVRIHEAIATMKGFMVWSSNRGGNHDIWRFDFPSGNISQITTHDHTEYYARISPDGTKIVFSRSQPAWVSQRQKKPWDVYIRDLANGQEQMIATNANTPTWSSDGKEVYYELDETKVAAYNLTTGEQRVLHEAGAGQVQAGVLMETPSYNDKDQRLAVTFRGPKRGTMMIEKDGTVRGIADGCQLTWAPDFSYLVYMDKGGKMKNAFYRIDPQTLKRSAIWLDLPEPYSHEYFPRVDNTMRYLVCGAAAKGHEHDKADYEIFLWKIGTPAEQAVRLTWHNGNDCWPDIYLEQK